MGEIIGLECTNLLLSSKFLPDILPQSPKINMILYQLSHSSADQTVFQSILMSVLQVVTDCTLYYENLHVRVSYQYDKTFNLFTKG